MEATVWMVHAYTGARQGSPVLEVEVPSRDPSRMLFYFTEPPFMYGKGTLVTLAVADGLLHEAISGWVEAIRAASL